MERFARIFVARQESDDTVRPKAHKEELTKSGGNIGQKRLQIFAVDKP